MAPAKKAAAKKAAPKGAAKSAELNRKAKKRAENTPGEGFNTAMKKVAKKKT